MDIRQLHYFVQVADCGNFSVASQKLFVSQPALSKTIKNMEDELGFTFFYTYQRKQRLTDAGQAFYEKAVHLLKEYDALMEMTYDEAGIDKGHIKIGLSTSAGPALFSHIFPKFRKTYPQIEFSIIEKDTNMLKEDILRKDIDLAFVDLNNLRNDDFDIFDVFELIRSDLVIAASAESPLSKYESIAYSDLDGKDFIAYNVAQYSSGQVEHEIKNAGSRLNVVLTSSQWNFIFEMVSANIGFAIVPYYIYNKLKTPNIIAIPIEATSGKRNIGLIASNDENRTRACRTFINYASNRELYTDIESKLFKQE